MKKKLIEFYLDWVNNFLTIQRMAEHYGLTISDTMALIEMGRVYHEESVELLKSKLG